MLLANPQAELFQACADLLLAFMQGEDMACLNACEFFAGQFDAGPRGCDQVLLGLDILLFFDALAATLVDLEPGGAAFFGQARQGLLTFAVVGQHRFQRDLLLAGGGQFLFGLVQARLLFGQIRR